MAAIEETYREDDLYELAEVRAHKINFTIHNEGDKYLEDALLRIEIPITQGLYIANQIHKKPVEKSGQFVPTIDWEYINYSRYEESNDRYIYKEHIGNLPHLQPREIFKVPLRMVVARNLAGRNIDITLILYSKDLPKPYSYNLTIRVVDIQSPG